MTIDVITKAGVQIGVSVSPEELTMSGWILDMIRMLIGSETDLRRMPGHVDTVLYNETGIETARKPKLAAAPQKKPPKNPRATEIDKGKIGALWESGRWSVAEIAKDVHCSEQTVRNTLKEQGLWKRDEAEADLL